MHCMLTARHKNWRQRTAVLENGMARTPSRITTAVTVCQTICVHCSRLVFGRRAQHPALARLCCLCFSSCSADMYIWLAYRRTGGFHSFLFRSGWGGSLYGAHTAVCCYRYAGAKQIPWRRMWRSLRAPPFRPEAAMRVLLSCQLGRQLCVCQRVWVVMWEEGFVLQCAHREPVLCRGSPVDKYAPMMDPCKPTACLVLQGHTDTHTGMFTSPPAAWLSTAVPSAPPGGRLGMPAPAKLGSPIRWGLLEPSWVLPACLSAPAWP